VAVIGMVSVLVALKGRILPFPLSGKPIFGLLFVQVKDALGELLVKTMPSLTNSPLQIVVSLTGFITGVGLTVTFTESLVTQLEVPADKLKT